MQPWRFELLSLSLCLAGFGCRGGTSEEPQAGEAVAEQRRPVAADEGADSGEPPPSAAAATNSESAAKPQPLGPPKDDVDRLPHLHGRSQGQMLAELGPPTSKSEMTMGECCHEYQVELYNTYPQNSGHEAVVIHEWSWSYDGYSVTLWFHREGEAWSVVNTLRYSDDVEF